MKKIYSNFNALICFSFLFILNPCNANTSVVLNGYLGSASNEIKFNDLSHYTLRSTNSTNIYTTGGEISNELFATTILSKYSVPCLIETVPDIDPDWLKFIPHFSRRIIGSSQKS